MLQRAPKSIQSRAKSAENQAKERRFRVQYSWGGRGRWFKSSHSDQKKSDERLVFGLFSFAFCGSERLLTTYLTTFGDKLNAAEDENKAAETIGSAFRFRFCLFFVYCGRDIGWIFLNQQETIYFAAFYVYNNSHGRPWLSYIICKNLRSPTTFLP